MTRTRSIVKRLAAAADRVTPTPTGITVLIYHRVGGGSDSAVDLDPADFERQLEHLAGHHRVLTLDQAVDELAASNPSGWSGETNGADEPEPGVVVTFDDGTADFGDIAVPALVHHHIPATLYAATHFVDSGDHFGWGAPPASWASLADAVSTGLISIGSHTHTHRLLDRLDPAAVDGELDRSIDLIGEHVGERPKHFAYPKAVLGSPAAEVAVRRRFATAALARNRVNEPGRTDLHRLWRTPIQRTDDIRRFARKAAGGLRLEGELRAAAATTRYRGETS